MSEQPSGSYIISGVYRENEHPSPKNLDRMDYGRETDQSDVAIQAINRGLELADDKRLSSVAIAEKSRSGLTLVVKGDPSYFAGHTINDLDEDFRHAQRAAHPWNFIAGEERNRLIAWPSGERFVVVSDDASGDLKVVERRGGMAGKKGMREMVKAQSKHLQFAIVDMRTKQVYVLNGSPVDMQKSDINLGGGGVGKFDDFKWEGVSKSELLHPLLIKHIDTVHNDPRMASFHGLEHPDQQ